MQKQLGYIHLIVRLQMILTRHSCSNSQLNLLLLHALHNSHVFQPHIIFQLTNGHLKLNRIIIRSNHGCREESSKELVLATT